MDPSAYTPPYDHSLCAALAGAGCDVELLTSRFPYSSVPAPDGYRLSERFYRRSAAVRGGRRGRRLAKLAEHVPDMVRARAAAGRADVVHYQWLPIEPLDTLLLPRRPRVLTVHKVRRRAGGRLARLSSRRLMDAMDAVVALSEDSARQLHGLGVDPARVHVIPHGAFDYLTRLPVETPLPPELAAVSSPVVLYFGTLRAHKGIDLLVEAFRAVEGAELWVVGMPDMAPDRLRDLMAAAGARVRFVARYVDDAEIPALMRRADVVVLPHRVVDESGALYCALAFGRPLLLSDVGGFVEVAERHGAARLFPAGDAAGLAAALRGLLDDEGERERLTAAAAAAASGPYSWKRIAEQTAALYAEVVEGG